MSEYADSAHFCHMNPIIVPGYESIMCIADIILALAEHVACEIQMDQWQCFSLMWLPAGSPHKPSGGNGGMNA